MFTILFLLYGLNDMDEESVRGSSDRDVCGFWSAFFSGLFSLDSFSNSMGVVISSDIGSSVDSKPKKVLF